MIAAIGPMAILDLQRRTAPQHAGIVLLAAQHQVSSAEIRDAVEDPLAAADFAMRLKAGGNSAALSPLALAAPRLATVPFTASVVAAIRHVINQDGPGDAHTLMATAASQGDLVQRTAGAVRLRLLSRRLPDRPPNSMTLPTC